MTSRQDQAIKTYSLRRYHAGEETERLLDSVTVEEPLAIRLVYRFKDAVRTEVAAVTMRTPGADRDLAAGYLYAENVISHESDIADIRISGEEVVVELADRVDVEAWRLARASVISSSCGVCGKRSIEALPPSAFVEGNDFSVTSEFITALPGLLTTQQAEFQQTGGIHAAALIDQQGSVAGSSEDIGRHNALDKLIGARLLAGSLPVSRHVIFLSSRGSFELVSKALAAGSPILATVGAPSSLAIDLARDRGLTLIGFVRDSRFNAYSHEWRVKG